MREVDDGWHQSCIFGSLLCFIIHFSCELAFIVDISLRMAQVKVHSHVLGHLHAPFLLVAFGVTPLIYFLNNRAVDGPVRD